MTSLLITARPLRTRVYLRELWAKRELVWSLGWRDLSLRFRHTAIGVAWLVLKPLLVLTVLVFVFGKVSGFGNHANEPYVLTVLSGLVPWMLFATALGDIALSVVNNQHIVTKVYFPRLTLPLAALFPCLADLAVGITLTSLVLLLFGVAGSWRMLFIPGLLLLLLLLALGLGLCLAALNTRYRDVQHVLPFLLTLGLYVSPVGYRFTNVPTDWQVWYNLNPLVGIIEGIRWALNPALASFHTNALLVSVAVTAGLLGLGFVVFRRMELRMADIL